MANEETNVKPKLTREQLRAVVFDTPWTSLDPETDGGKHGLTPLLLHRIGHNLPGDKQTVAQGLVDLLIDGALDGRVRLQEEILIRIDGEARSAEPAAKVVKTSFEIDELTAQRVLDAFCKPGEGPPGH